MTLLQELEQKAGKLPAAERAALVSRLLATLPPILSEADNGVAEAKRRNAELDANPSAGLSSKQFRAAIALQRKRESATGQVVSRPYEQVRASVRTALRSSD